MATATFTSEFAQEFDAETGRLLRRRFMWFLGLNLAFWAFGLAAVLFAPNDFRTAPVIARVLFFVVAAIDISVYVWFFQRVRRSRPDKTAILRLTRVMLLYIGSVGLLQYFFQVPGASTSIQGFPTATFSFGLAFFFACLFLPWSPREVYRTVGIVLALHAVVLLAVNLPPNANWLWLMFFPVLVAPGFAVCAIKHSSRMRAFKMRFLSSRYTEVRREMTDARRIHEDLFPEPRDVGDIVFTYTYQPMRQIGGDYLFCFESPGIEGRVAVNIVLLDVTGHGLAAALTVNRLHGELERIFAEDPHAEPGHVLGLLNRYVHLTLAQHSIYASAVCLRIDPTTNELTYANAGHPPMFLRGVDGTIEELDSTAIVLGACRPEDFHADPQTHTFVPGDMLIAYTDGAMEARDEKGKCIGRNWLTAMIAATRCGPGEWPRRIIAELDARRSGPPEDDTLVIEVQRRLATDAARLHEAQGQHA